MAVIWGLDLKEIHYSKFKSSYMWNKDYHLRRAKFIVYQLALIFCVISESLGTDALSNYNTEQDKVNGAYPAAHLSNSSYIGAASYNIFAGVFVATIFGAAFFFDLFWPERHESHSVRLAWKVCGVLSVVFYLASAITLTVITFTQRGVIHNATPDQAEQLLRLYKKHSQAPLDYGKNSRAIAAVSFAWPGLLSVIGSCFLLFRSIDYTESGSGPRSKIGRAHAQRPGYGNRSESEEYKPNSEMDSAGQSFDGTAERMPQPAHLAAR